MSTSQLMAQVTALLSSWNEREREFRDWLAGTATGGPNGDGKYPLTNANGDTFLVDCPAKLADTVAGPAGVSLEAQEAAEEALAQAVNQALQATQQNTAAASARALTQQLRDEAEVFRDEAAASNAAAGAARSGAEAARDTATARANAAATSETNAGLSQITASQQATAAQAARVAAEVARDQAQAAAASINPATLATKAELQAELNALVGAAPGTLNTLNELAAALGNNPNFAATITAQIAAKADATHTHTIAQVTGLQTALDARAPLTHTHTIAQVTGLQAALDAKQNNIGFTPVQQGGGTDQGANKLFIGWHTSGDGLRLQVDSTNFGKVWPIDIQGTAGAVAWGNIVGRPSTFTPAAHGHAIADVSGLQAALDNRLLRGVDQWITSTDGRSRFFFGNNGRTFFGSPNGYEWRNASDAGIMWLENWGDLTLNGNTIFLNSAAPTIWWRDTNHRAFGIHVNDDIAYFMRGGTNNPNWDGQQINGRWPMTLNLNNGWLGLAAGIDAAEVVARSTIWIGDDVRLMDLNSGNTVYVVGQQNADRGYVNFGNGPGNSLLGAVAGGALTYNGNTVWHSGNFDPGSRAALVHGHGIGDVSGLQGALDARVPWSEYNGSGRQSLTANGYQRLPGGLILQWGSVFITANSTATVTYPISFPNAAFIVIADGGETVTNRQDNGPAVSSFNNFNASITNGIDVGISTRWFAIGW
jgi:hypothetical protein